MAHHEDEKICLHQRDFEDLLTRAAERGAEEALARIGLTDDKAAGDIHDLRSLMEAYRFTKRTAAKSIVQRLVDLVLVLIVIGAAAKLSGHWP